LWLGFPLKLFPKAVAALTELLHCPDAGELMARPDLSHYLRRAIEFMQSNDQNELEIKCHNLVYLHVNYNTFRLAFWALSNLLETPEAVTAMRAELDELLETRYNPETNTASLDSVDIDSLKVLGMIHAAAQFNFHETYRVHTSSWLDLSSFNVTVTLLSYHNRKTAIGLIVMIITICNFQRDF